MTPETIKRS